MICGVDANVLIYSAVESMPEHKAVLAFFERRVLTGELVCAVSFPILLEFIHITTDPKRFKRPLTLEESLDFASQYWNAEGWSRLLPKADIGEHVLALLRQHKLGRKRLLDTYLAATLLDNGIEALITCDPADFAPFKKLQVINPLE
jgi:predicted nucleic acid-binding protein